jgi:hypothetical protein
MNVDLTEYRPERPERFQLETVESMMYVTDHNLLTEWVSKAATKFDPADHEVLDIGTFHGASAIIMAKASNFRIVTLDPYPGPRINESFKHHGVGGQIFHYTIKSEDYLWDPETKIAFMMIDGLHYLTQVKFEFYYFGQFIPKGGYVAFHDVGKEKWPGMAAVIHEACDSGKWKMVDLEGYMCILEKL